MSGSREDRFEIRELIERYSYSVNERDWVALESCYTEDAVWDVGPPFDFRLEGRAQIVEIASGKISEELYVVQTPHATVVQVDGLSANAITTMFEAVRSVDGGMQIIGTYYDRLVKTVEGWRFTERKFRVTNFEAKPPTGDVFRVFE